MQKSNSVENMVKTWLRQSHEESPAEDDISSLPSVNTAESSEDKINKLQTTVEAQVEEIRVLKELMRLSLEKQQLMEERATKQDEKQDALTLKNQNLELKLQLQQSEAQRIRERLENENVRLQERTLTQQAELNIVKSQHDAAAAERHAAREREEALRQEIAKQSAELLATKASFDSKIALAEEKVKSKEILFQKSLEDAKLAMKVDPSEGRVRDNSGIIKYPFPKRLTKGCQHQGGIYHFDVSMETDHEKWSKREQWQNGRWVEIGHFNYNTEQWVYNSKMKPIIS